MKSCLSVAVLCLSIFNISLDASANESCFSKIGLEELKSNPYAKGLDGGLLIHEAIEKGHLCVIDSYVNSGIIINPYMQDENGVSLIDKMFGLEAVDSIGEFKEVLNGYDSVRYADLKLSHTLKDKNEEEIYPSLPQDLFFSKFYKSARVVLDKRPDLNSSVDSSGFTVPQALVASLDTDDLEKIKDFKDLDFNLYSKEIGITPMQILCKKDYIKSFSYLMAEGNSPFETNLYGSDTVDVIKKHNSRYCSALIKTIVYELKGKE